MHLMETVPRSDNKGGDNMSKKYDEYMDEKHSKDENLSLINESNQDNNLCYESEENKKSLSEISDRQAMEEFLISVFQFGIEAIKKYSENNKEALNSKHKVATEDKEEKDLLLEEESNIVDDKSVNVWVYNNTVVDFSNFIATVDGEITNLGVVPIRILKFLLEHKGQTLTREQILNHVWGGNKELYDRTVDSHISTLKKTLNLKTYIRSIRGIGYRID